jgi:hypothetical protein
MARGGRQCNESGCQQHLPGQVRVSYAALLADAHWRRPEAHLTAAVPKAISFLISLVLVAVAMTLLLRRFRLALALAQQR